ncbi:MAG TPA: BatA domain-containing protein [Phycisphaerae bacterium]|nr:BatA domain-containing protein [Phycisphaerae bacterium]
MSLALSFTTPLLLLGLLAAGIPFVLHLLSSVRAQDMMFPTLRFLRMSMEKTARRRRLQHWLLLILRAALFALLALAVAEPISRATGGWLSGQRYAAAIVLDNGYSMAVNTGGSSRFERAKADATALLSGDEKPAVAALLTTNGGLLSHGLSGGLDELREGIARARIGYGPVPLAQRFEAAVRMLEDDSSPRKAIYVFSDLQRAGFERIAALDGLARGKDLHVLVVDTAAGQVNNVGIGDLDIAGRRVVDSVLEFTVALINSSPTDKTVDVGFQIDGAPSARRVRKTLRAAGLEGSTATVRFHHRFAEAGDVSGKVFLDSADDLALDNVRRFSLTIGGRVRALVVRGPGEVGAVEPSLMLRLALQPYEEAAMPWPIRASVVEADRLSADELRASDIVFLCEVPKLSAEQAKAIEQFAAAGGTVVVFLGADVDAASYNDGLVQQVSAEGGLLPGRLDRPVGEIGPTAESVKIARVAIDHPFFLGLYESHADYLSVLVQRYWRLEPSARPGQVLIELTDGRPLLIVKPFGGGRVVLCTTSAAPVWSNLPITGLFLPMVARMSLLARRELHAEGTYLAGAQVPIRPDFTGFEPPAPDEKLFVHITPPTENGAVKPPAPLPLARTPEGLLATFRDTAELGVYRWKVARPGGADAPGGAFAVNPFGPESQLDALPARTFQKALAAQGMPRVYVAPSLAAVHAAAAEQSEGRNWWDLLLAVVIMVLVFEAIVANRRTREEVVPTHLQPNAPV